MKVKGIKEGGETFGKIKDLITMNLYRHNRYIKQLMVVQ